MVLFEYDQKFHLKIGVGHSDLYISQSSDFAFYLEKDFMYKQYFQINLLYCPEFYLKINEGHSDIFHSPLILPYILNYI